MRNFTPPKATGTLYTGLREFEEGLVHSHTVCTSVYRDSIWNIHEHVGNLNVVDTKLCVIRLVAVNTILLRISDLFVIVHVYPHKKSRATF